jgi:hypothetical protein
MLRYQTPANRGFQRQSRMLEHHYKTHKPIPAELITEEETFEKPPRCGIHVVGGTNSSSNRLNRSSIL